MTPKAWIAVLALCSAAASLPTLAQARSVHRGRRASLNEAQVNEVKAAVARLKEAGLPEALPAAPNVENWPQVLVSDAVSVVEVAYADFSRRAYYLSIQNPWTNETKWYGDFPL